MQLPLQAALETRAHDSFVLFLPPQDNLESSQQTGKTFLESLKILLRDARTRPAFV
jgi:hypothetical protein